MSSQKILYNKVIEKILYHKENAQAYLLDNV